MCSSPECIMHNTDKNYWISDAYCIAWPAQNHPKLTWLSFTVSQLQGRFLHITFRLTYQMQFFKFFLTITTKWKYHTIIRKLPQFCISIQAEVKIFTDESVIFPSICWFKLNICHQSQKLRCPRCNKSSNTNLQRWESYHGLIQTIQHNFFICSSWDTTVAWPINA